MLITNGKIITPKEILTGHTLLVQNGKIARVAPAESVTAAPNEEVLDAAGCFVAPGFIDLHVHGAVGCDTMDGDLESLAKIGRYHASGGTTAMLPTTVSASAKDIKKAIQTVAEAQSHDFGGAQILGIHLEGPYLSSSKRGCHDPKQLRNPDPEEYNAWLERDDVIALFTLAPELEGSLELIDKLVEHEIIPCGGHSDASEEVVRQAAERGLSHVAHLFNSMSAMKKEGVRRVAGFAEAALADDNLTVEIIADGIHLPASVMKLAIKAKGVDRVCLVTNATAGAGLPEGSEFMIGDIGATVTDGVGLMSDKSRLAGSTSQMITMVRTIASLGIPMVDAVRMASLTPARVLGLSGTKGSLEEPKTSTSLRKDADIVIFDDAFNVRQTIVGGKTVYPAAV